MRRAARAKEAEAVEHINPIDFLPASLTFSIGPLLGNIALRYVAYPSHVLAKSTKSIAVMLTKHIAFEESFAPSDWVETGQ